MFSEELSKLIEASLVDGVITDQERAVIRKRALLEGVDPDEVDLVLDAEIQKINSQNKQTKQGVVKKCPACGAIYEAGSVKCSQCGYVFVNVNANKSAELLTEKLDKVRKYFKEKDEKGRLDEFKLDKLLGEAIKGFPVPVSKDDLLEFIPSMESKWTTTSAGSGTTHQKEAYKAKYYECLSKAHAQFGNDPQFQYFFDKEEKMNKKFIWARMSNGKQGLIIILCLIAFSILLGILSSIVKALGL